MSMTTLVILQFIKIFLVYTGVTVVLPKVMFRSILKGRRLSEQLLMSYTFGNFYIINIVFALQLLHISNLFTLVFVTTALSFFICVKVNQIPLTQKLERTWELNRRMIQETMGTKQALYRLMFRVKLRIKRCIFYLYHKISRNWVQTFFFMLLLYSLFWIYGRQMIMSYGYHASDIPVHMSWINQMGRGNLFCSGVYPFGFHCIIYYLHIVFGIDTYVLMCRFSFVQVIFVHLILFAALKCMCRSKYMPYAATLIYIIGGFFTEQTYNRYRSALPQEYGMIFVIPSIYFLICFFWKKKDELKTKETRLILQCFAMAFSLTLAIHFYGTMVAGLCCVAIAIGFCTRFFRKDYFIKIMITGLVSVFLAVLPMGIAFATGTPLQGSLGWGLSVMNQSSSDSTDTAENEQQSTQSQSTQSQSTKSQSTDDTEQTAQEETEKKPILTKVIYAMKYNIFSMEKGYEKYVQKGPYVIFMVIGALICLGLIQCIFRRREYGMMLISVGLSTAMILAMLLSKELGIPTLMDAARSSIYFTYLLSVAAALVADGAISLVFMPEKIAVLRTAASFLIMIMSVGFLFQNHQLKRVRFESSYVKNGSIICLSNIIYGNDDLTWTIVSAGDELQMGLDHGWHYEVSDFLWKMENWKETSKVYIPTRKVYIYIEKIVKDDDSEPGTRILRSVSKQGASMQMPKSEGNSMYIGKNRWILMSKMYYWAEAFKTKYPNEMKTYYEADDFICYEMDQNVYHLYNFAIDYGYNEKLLKETED